MGKKDVLKGRSIVRKETKSEEEKISVSLKDVAEYYHKKLFENEKATGFLESIGIKNKELYSRFKVGFSDGSLLNVIGDNQKEELKKLGMLLEDETEKYLNCIVFPMSNEQEQTESFYGINIDDSRTFGGMSGRLFNEKALKVYNERVILAEGIIEALSLMEIGFNNVVSFEGRFEIEYIERLKSFRIKEVVLALKDEVSSIMASDVIRELLNGEGIAVRVLYSPQGFVSWNDVLKKSPLSPLLKGTRGDSLKEEVLDLIELAKVSNVEESKDLTVKKDGLNYIFTVNEISYRLAGVKDMFVSNLKVNVRAELRQAQLPDATEKYFDNLDLYSARSRTTYSQNLANIFNIESKRVEKDLIQILEYLERERDKRLSGKEKDEKIMLTDEERILGLSFLKSPDMFKTIVDDMTTLGYVGEDLNKQLLYLCASSRILDDPISIMIISQSSAGKSMLVDTVKKLIPPEETLALNSMSDQAFNYIKELLHKFVILGEAVHNETIEHQIREMLSNKELTRLVTMKDPKTGELSSEIKKVETIIGMVMTTTNTKPNAENASRCFVINADESKEQTRRIHEAQRKQYTLDRYYEQSEKIPHIIRKHHAAQRLLRKQIIFNPFAKHLDFPDALMRSRRDHFRFLVLIATVCFLRQYQKEIKKSPVSPLVKGMRGDSLEYIECDLTDYEIAYNIMINGVLLSTMVELPGSALELYKELRTTAKKQARENNLNVNEVSFTQREIREETGFGQSWIRENLRVLVEFEYVSRVRGNARGERGFYRLKADEEIRKQNFKMIPTPEEMKEIANSRK